MEQTTLTERVNAGATLLDELKPGWAHLINLDSLRMRQVVIPYRTCGCVLSQLAAPTDEYGPGWNGYAALAADLLGVEVEKIRCATGEIEAPYGFTTVLNDEELADLVDAEWAALDAAWRSEIEARTS